MSGQLHARANFAPCKEPPVPNGKYEQWALQPI
jgi:hypothetical protein